MKAKKTAVSKYILSEILSEMGHMVLGSKRLDHFLKYCVLAVPEVLKCDFVAISLNRLDTVHVGVGVRRSGLRLKDDFQKNVKKKIERHLKRPVIWTEAQLITLEEKGVTKVSAKAKVVSFHLHPLTVWGERIGSISVGAVSKDAFAKYHLNMLESFAEQVALGLQSFLDRNVIKEQSSKLEADKKRFETIIGGMKEGLILLDKDGMAIAVNSAASALMDSKIDEGADARDFSIKELQSDLEKKQAFEKVVFLSSPAKSTIHVRATPIFDPSNQYQGMAVILIDVTRDREIDKMKSDFVSAVSHELRTPLASIREAIALVFDGVAGDLTEKQKKCLEIALRNSDRLTRLINDLLNLSKIESGKIEMKRTSVSLEQVVGNVISTFEPQAQKAKAALKTDLDKDLPHVFADPDQLTQVLTNLIGNSMKFTPEGGEVRVAACDMRYAQASELMTHDAQLMTDRCFVEISVTDTGPGISEADQKLLFQKFSQLDTGLTRKPGGTGLGLVISKEIVEKHGGRIWIESEVGKGTSFKFTLPVFRIEMVYLDIISQQINRVKMVHGHFYLVVAKPLSPESDKKAHSAELSRIESGLKDVFGEKAVVFKYGSRLVIAVLDSDLRNTEPFMDALDKKKEEGFQVEIISYPQDGITSEELMERVLARY
ncbi:MAG: hypothetical protein COV46_08645 [Deltaproteobacteria bacterium CG11_big_fil_rev_8_21_14_0_20_49_13]|nr:MAG: hypothetical protein COV46_08645 [Deltaproteobacteria bacterium CG11_big_fil_rev_8_21_14_0_20_49_13]